MIYLKLFSQDFSLYNIHTYIMYMCAATNLLYSVLRMTRYWLKLPRNLCFVQRIEVTWWWCHWIQHKNILCYIGFINHLKFCTIIYGYNYHEGNSKLIHITSYALAFALHIIIDLKASPFWRKNGMIDPRIIRINSHIYNIPNQYLSLFNITVYTISLCVFTLFSGKNWISFIIFVFKFVKRFDFILCCMN